MIILQVVVLLKLRGMRNLRKLGALGALGLDEVLEQLLGEHTAGGQGVVVGPQGIQRLGEAGGQALDLRFRRITLLI